MTARVRYTADALYPEYKTARLETFGEDMTNQKRRIEDKLPTEPLDWTEAEDAAWQELAAGAVNAGITSEENGAGDLPAWMDETIRLLGSMRVAMHWPDLERHIKQLEVTGAAIAAHLARQPKAEQPAGLEDLATYPSPHGTLIRLADAKCRLAHLARQAQAGTPRVDALMAKWDDDGATRGSAFIELRDLARELERRAAPVAPASAQNDLPDREKLLRVALDAADKWASTEHLHARDIGKGGRGDEKAVVRAENAARKAINALAEAGAQNAEAIRNQALEDAARVVDDFQADKGIVTFSEIAHEIRALQSGTATTKTGDAE
jgi:hypothetical protein